MRSEKFECANWSGHTEVEALVFVGEVGALHKQLGVLAEPVSGRCVQVLLRCLILLEARDTAHIRGEGALGAVVVRQADLDALVLVPQDEVPRLGGVVLERDFVPGEIPLPVLLGA